MQQMIFTSPASPPGNPSFKAKSSANYLLPTRVDHRCHRDINANMPHASYDPSPVVFVIELAIRPTRDLGASSRSTRRR
jgi:hypothetical protein